MNLNSLDEDDPKRKYQPYADEPGPRGTDKPGCFDVFPFVALAFVLLSFAIADLLGVPV